MFKSLACLSSVVLLSTTAHAADIVATPEPAPVVAAPAFSWTGFYAGGQIGGSWSDGDFDREVTAKNETSPNVFVDTKITDITSKSIDDGNFIGGLYAGYNYQFQNNVVIGLDADIAWINNTTKSNKDIPVGEYSIEGFYNKVEQDWYAAVRGRLGYAYNRFLPYIAGGVAFTDIDYKKRYFGDVRKITFDRHYSDSSTFTGWTIGAGFDYAMTDHIILRAEYRYTDFGDDDFSADWWKNNVDLKANDLRVGVAYKF